MRDNQVSAATSSTMKPGHTAFRSGHVLSVLLLTAMLSGCRPAEVEERAVTTVVGSGGIVVTEDSLATEVGVGMLRAGGNAVDAAVAAAFALAVTFPEAGNVGGGGFVVVYDEPRNACWGVDFRETAPGAAYAHMYKRLTDAGVADASTVGPLSAGIPGTPAGLYEVWKQGGSMPWAELLAPAIRLARQGFPVGERLRRGIAEKADGLGRFPSSADVFLIGGAPPPLGTRFVQEDLGAVLQVIADRGARGFYEGPVADKLIRAVRDNGGIWTSEDLSGYRAVFRTPVRIRLSAEPKIELITMPPPSSGAQVIGHTISLMRAQGVLACCADDPRRAAAFVEALRLAFADRNTYLADPDRMTVSLSELLSESYLKTRARLLPPSPPGDSGKVTGGPAPGESRNTTHIVVIDREGRTVSLTTTINSRYGSKFVAAGTGVLLNNEMDDFDTRPGQPNIYGLVGTGVNSVAPGARMLSSMSPTIVVKRDSVWFALGARGGPHILSAILQVIFRRCIDGADLADAVASPRIHHQWLPDTVYVEAGNVVQPVRDGLRRMGYRVGEEPFLARVLAAERLGANEFTGVVDPRTTGLARAVTESPGRGRRPGL